MPRPGVSCLRLATIVTTLVLVVVAGCGSEQRGAPPGVQPSPNPSGGTPIRVLMLTTTAGFRHDSIPTARAVMTDLASSTGVFTVTATEDLSSLGTASLSNYDVVFFALTTGELALSADQKTALVDFVSHGKGFLGAHSATDTLYDWPEYGRLVGAYFNGHPWTQPATVIVEDPSHPATTGLGASFVINEEFYVFRENPRPSVQVLLRLDAASVGASGDYPLAWAHAFGEGRAYYNALGHFSATWTDPRFQQQIVGAIRWVAKRRPHGARLTIRRPTYGARLTGRVQRLLLTPPAVKALRSDSWRASVSARSSSSGIRAWT